MRLIDADAIRVKPEYMENVCGMAMIRAEDLARILNEQPTIVIDTLLKEQEAVEPISEHHLFLCPVCKNTLFREQKFCHECGKRIAWEGR